MSQFAAFRRDLLVAILFVLVGCAMDIQTSLGGSRSMELTPLLGLFAGIAVTYRDLMRRLDAQRERIRRLEVEVARLRTTSTSDANVEERIRIP